MSSADSKSAGSSGAPDTPVGASPGTAALAKAASSIGDRFTSSTVRGRLTGSKVPDGESPYRCHYSSRTGTPNVLLGVGDRTVET